MKKTLYKADEAEAKDIASSTRVLRGEAELEAQERRRERGYDILDRSKGRTMPSGKTFELWNASGHDFGHYMRGKTTRPITSYTSSSTVLETPDSVESTFLTSALSMETKGVRYTNALFSK